MDFDAAVEIVSGQREVMEYGDVTFDDGLDIWVNHLVTPVVVGTTGVTLCCTYTASQFKGFLPKIAKHFLHVTTSSLIVQSARDKSMARGFLKHKADTPPD